MKILVDLDGIVTDTLPTWLDRIHHHSGVRAYCQDIKRWNLNENPPLDKVPLKVLFGILNEPGFNLELQQLPGASSNLQKLVAAGHDVSIVTARSGDNCIPETIKWLKAFMPWFNAEKKAWFCYDKHRITGDVLIDDKAETLLYYQQEHPKAKLITIDYPYNKDFEIPGVIRLQKDNNVWDNIRQEIEKMSKEHP